MNVFAQAAPQSMLSWYYQSLGLFYASLMPLVGLVAFLLTIALVVKGKGPAMGAALVFVVPLPLVVGCYGALDGTMISLMVISQSPVGPTSSELANGLSMALVAPFFGMLLMAPSYFAAIIGLSVRSFLSELAHR